MANESAAALQNQFALNQLFQAAVAPANAYFAQKTALEIQKAREDQARTRQLQDIEAQRAFAVQERQAAEIAAVRAQAAGIAGNLTAQKTAEAAATARQDRAFTQSQVAADRNKADEIRFGQFAQTARALGLDTSTFEEDDAGLIAAYNKAAGAKGAMEKVDTDEAANIQATIGGLFERMRTTGDPERDKAARRAFFTNPEVSNILTKELGADKFNQAAIEKYINGDDNSVVDRVIKSAAETWYGGTSDKIAQSLVSNWGTALQAAQPGLNVQSIMSSIPELMTRHKAVLNRGNIRNPEALTRAVTLPLSEYDKKRQADAAARIKAMQDAAKGAGTPAAAANFSGATQAAPATRRIPTYGMLGSGVQMAEAPQAGTDPFTAAFNYLNTPTPAQVQAPFKMSTAKQWNPYAAPAEFIPQPVPQNLQISWAPLDIQAAPLGVQSPISLAPLPNPQVQWAPLPPGAQYDPRQPMW
jgi:hypothetical protein